MSDVQSLFPPAVNSLCSARNGDISPVFLVESTGTKIIHCEMYPVFIFLSITVSGFSGAYGHESGDINTMLGRNGRSVQARGRRQTDQTQIIPSDQPQFDGIDDPTICLEFGQMILFQVSNISYPVYDVDNLLNTNPEFDYGIFTLLAEAQQLSLAESQLLFPYRFDVNGVFVFHLSNDINRKTYVRVVELSAQCPEQGPFFPTTSSTTTQLGIVRSDDILIAPNWILIGSMIAGAVVLMAILTVALVRILKLLMGNEFALLVLGNHSSSQCLCLPQSPKHRCYSVIMDGQRLRFINQSIVKPINITI